MNTNTEFLGFRVEWTGNDKAPAIFYGSRGAVYGAMRPREESDWCYLVDVGHRTPGQIRRIRGNGWVEIPRGEQTIRGAR